MTISLGSSAQLKIVQLTDFGVYLNAGELGKILLPRKYVPQDSKLDDEVSVFLYLDSQDLPIATTQIPKAEVGEFAYLKVIDTNRVGAFLDWGLDKDLLLPFSEQLHPMKKDDYCLVYVTTNKSDQRIIASAKYNKFLDLGPVIYNVGAKVNLLIADKSNLGYKAIINNKYIGLLYLDQLFTNLKVGDKVQGFIKNIRADNKIDLSLTQGSKDEFDDYAQRILTSLKANNGFLNLTDKTDAETVYKQLQMSKKNFKRAIGFLYKERIIRLEDDGLYLI